MFPTLVATRTMTQSDLDNLREKLLALPAPEYGPHNWETYRACGLDANDVAALTRLATPEEIADDPDSRDLIIHAQRALAQMQAVEAFPRLLEFLQRLGDEDDDIAHDYPLVLAATAGDDAEGLFEPLRAGAWSDYARSFLPEAVAAYGVQHPSRRDEAVALLTKTLQESGSHDRIFNALLVAGLIHLAAAESAPVIEQAFVDGRVDIITNGLWGDVAAELEVESTLDHSHDLDSISDEETDWLQEQMARIARAEEERRKRNQYKAARKDKRKKDKALKKKQRRK